MPLYEFDARLRTGEARLLAGIDEAGRGPIAGPVVAAAVILPPEAKIDGLRDSKLVPEAERFPIFESILASAISIGVGISDVETIDRVNILEATKRAMAHAVGELSPVPDLLVIDAVALQSVRIRQVAEIKGDAKSASVAAASIVAKVVRDAVMLQYHEQYPLYGFNQHKGYGTKKHMEMVQKYGPCPQHRRTFGGVRNLELPF